MKSPRGGDGQDVAMAELDGCGLTVVGSRTGLGSGWGGELGRYGSRAVHMPERELG